MGRYGKENGGLLKPSKIHAEVGITPVNCRLKNPMNTPKSFLIIHKGEKQLLQERVRNINHTLHLWELKRQECYSKLRNLVQDSELKQCILLTYQQN